MACDKQAKRLVTPADLDIADLFTTAGLETYLLRESVRSAVKDVHDYSLPCLVQRDDVSEHVRVDVCELNQLLVR